MKVGELMTKDPEACVQTDSCAAALEIMKRRDCGFVPVVHNHRTREVTGVVTDRDIALHFEKLSRPASEVPVSGCMTKDVKTIAPTAGLNEAAKLMEQFAIHRLPVVEHGRLVGVLSLKDIAVAADKRWAYPESRSAEQKLGEIVEAIASARS